MSKERALIIIKAAFETMKKGIMTDSIVEKQSIATMLEALSDKIEQAFEVLEKG